MPSQFGLGILQMVSGQVWLVGGVLDSAGQLKRVERQVWGVGREELHSKCIKASKQSRQDNWIKNIERRERKVTQPLQTGSPGRSLRRWHRHWALNGKMAQSDKDLRPARQFSGLMERPMSRWWGGTNHQTPCWLESLFPSLCSGNFPCTEEADNKYLSIWPGHPNTS